MARLPFSKFSTTALLVVICFNLCHGFFYHYQYPPSLRFTIPEKYKSNRPRFEFKRVPGFDRISMGFIKRGSDTAEGPVSPNFYDLQSQDWEPMTKRHLDAIATGLIRRKRSVDDVTAVQSEHRRKKRSAIDQETDGGGTSGEDVKRLDRIGMSFIKKGYDGKNEQGNPGYEKRRLDRVSMGLVKKEHPAYDEGVESEKRGLDRVAYGLVKKEKEIVDQDMDDLTDADKQYLENMNLVLLEDGDDKFGDEGLYAPNSDIDKRRMDRLAMGLVRRADEGDGYRKRYLDRIQSSFIKKNSDLTDLYRDRVGMAPTMSDDHEKRGFDRVAMGLVKKSRADAFNSEKRRFDRVGMGLVKKRPFDKVAMGLIKKDIADGRMDGLLDKRRFDRVGMGLVKKEDSEVDKRRFDRVGMGLVKKEDSEVDKRRFDRVGMGLVKKEDSEVDKRRFDRVGMGLVKKEDSEVDKRRFDRVGMGLVKKEDPEVDKRRFDRVGMGLVKKEDSEVDKRRFDRVGMGLVKKEDYEVDKRRFDRVGMGLVKKEDYEVDKRRFDRVGMGLVKKEDYEVDKRRFDRVGMGLVKKEDYEVDKRRFDRVGMGLVKKDNVAMAAEKRRMDRVAMGFIKRASGRYGSGRTKRSPWWAENNYDLDRIGAGLIKRSDLDSPLPYDYYRAEQKRYFDRMATGLLKRNLDRIAYGLV